MNLTAQNKLTTTAKMIKMDPEPSPYRIRIVPPRARAAGPVPADNAGIIQNKSRRKYLTTLLLIRLIGTI